MTRRLRQTVLWLRKFGVDISCVELTPYRYPGDQSNILLVPKVLIPLAEARTYQISVEKKERRLQEQVASDSSFYEFWKLVREQYVSRNPLLPAPRSAWQGNWYQMTFGSKFAHYEWMVKKGKRQVIEVAIHFEAEDRASSLALAEKLLASCPNLGEGVAYEVESGPHGTRNAFVQFAVPYTGEFVTTETATEAARLMDILIRRTMEVLRAM